MLEFLEKFIYLVVRVFFELYFFIFGEPQSDKNADKISALYNKDNFSGWFTKIRFWDAPYKEVEDLVSKKGVITELGCGEGVFSNYIALNTKRKIFGFDIDKRRIKEAQRGLKNTKFKQADVTKLEIPKSDTIVMFHLLHHLLNKEAQDNLVKKSIKSLKKNGKLIIIEIDNKPFFKYIFTYLVDHVLIAWLFERKVYEPNIFFRSENDWGKLFKENNLSYKRFYASNGKPFSNIIFVCSKTQTK